MSGLPAAKNDAARLADRIAGDIRGRVLYGVYEPGRRISERAVTEEFGVSRAPVREALRLLHAEGALEILPNRGARVPRYDRRLIEQTIEVVEYMEAAAGELACRRISDEQISRIAALTAQMQARLNGGDRLHYYRINKQIHEEIIRSSGNSVLIGDYIKYNNRLYRTRFLPSDSGRNILSAMREHKRIVVLLRRRDAAALSAMLAKHLSHAWRRAGVQPVDSAAGAKRKEITL